MPLLRPALATVTSAGLLAWFGCAGHRGPPVPEIATLQPFNGEWVLEAEGRERLEVQFASQDGYGFTEETMQKVGALVRRTLPGTGWVSNRFELAAEGTLVITRTAAVRNYRGREVEATSPIQFVYARSTGSRW